MKEDNNGIQHHSFDFTEAVERFKARVWELDGFCVDETLVYFMLNPNAIEDTQTNRHIYYVSLRNHLLELKVKCK